MTLAHGAFTQPLMAHGGSQTTPVRTKLCWARWTASTDAAQTVTDTEGVVSIAYAATGVYTVTFASAGTVVIPLHLGIAVSDVAKYQKIETTSTGTQSAVFSIFEKAKANAVTGDWLAASGDTLVLSIAYLVVGY